MNLRIISGDLRGKKLNSIRGAAIRPTADRLREAMFNILSFCVQDAVVLDLFAGTGALGIEALSRGAESAVFVENNNEAVSVIERNVKSCGFAGRTNIIRWNIKKNLDCLQYKKPAFALAFLDPPYQQGMVKPALFNLYRSKSLQREAKIVVEHSNREAVPKDLLAFETTDQRRYGKTLVSFLKYVV